MKTNKKLLVILLTLVLVLCAAFAVSCKKDNKKYCTVTFIDGEEVYTRVKVEMGKRVEFPAEPTRDDENYIFDGWYLDENAENKWDDKVERVTKDVVLWSNFLYVSNVPNNIAMDDSAFSNAVTWLQRGIDANTEFSVATYQGMLISATEYAYSQQASNDESALKGEQGGVTLTPYRNHNNVFIVKWTPAEKPQGGVYSVKVTCANGTGTQGGLYFKGAGTQSNPYLLTNDGDLEAVNSVDVASGNYYKLQQSINVKLKSQSILGKTFDGFFDGNGKTVTIDAGGCGLFGSLGDNAVIEDLTVDGSIESTTANCVGIIASVNNGRIEYCTVSAGIKSSLGTVGKLEGDSTSIVGGAGGLVGVNNGVVVNCTYSGAARASVGAGGIAVINNGDITNCAYSGTLGAGNAIESGSSTNEMSYMGGIAAINYGKIELCTATGRLLAQRSMTGAGTNNNIGGIVALNTADGVIERCFTNSQRVYGNNNVGGIAGENSGAIAYCYVTAAYRSNITLHNYIGGSANVGGIVGLTNAGATVTNCYALANVYAYDGAAYKVAASCENCVYINGNLDDRDITVIDKDGNTSDTPANALTAPVGANVELELTDEVKTQFATSAYTLTLDEEQFATLSGDKNYYKSRTNVTFGVTVGAKEREIDLAVIVGETTQTATLGKVAGNRVKPTAPDTDDGYVVGYALVPNGEVVVEYGKAVGYADLVAFNRDTITLYPVYKQGTRPENTVLKVALWDRYVQEDTVVSLLNAYKQSEYYNSKYSVIYTVLSSKDNNAFKTDYELGDFNVAFAYAASAVDAWQDDRVEVSIFNVYSNAYGTLKVGLNSADPVVTKFGEFLAGDEAKKIMNPNYIEVTLYNGEEKLGVQLVLSGGSLELDTLDDTEDYVFAGWSVNATAVEDEALFNRLVSYDTLAAIAQNKALTLYARFVEDGQVKPNYTLKIALWDRYVQEETVVSLINAYKQSDLYQTEFDATYTVLSSSNNSNFKTDYINGDFNVAFAYAAAAVDEWQEDRIEVYIYNVNSSGYGTLKVGLNSEDEVVTNFGLFLATDAAKKIMNPAFISEAEADLIEVTLMNGDTQHGDKLTLSNATETQYTKIALPTITEIPTGYVSFMGWALTETANDDEILLIGNKTYADLATYANDGNLTLYARFKAETTDPEPTPSPERTIIVGYWTYGDVVNSTVIAALAEEFKTYAKENNLTFAVEFREYSIDTYAKVADLVGQLAEDGDVAYVLGIGKGSGDLVFVDGTKQQVGSRYVAQLIDDDDAGAFHTFATQSTILQNA